MVLQGSRLGVLGDPEDGPEEGRRGLAFFDPERLERWLEKAVVAPSAAAALDEPN